HRCRAQEHGAGVAKNDRVGDARRRFRHSIGRRWFVAWFRKAERDALRGGEPHRAQGDGVPIADGVSDDSSSEKRKPTRAPQRPTTSHPNAPVHPTSDKPYVISNEA